MTSLYLKIRSANLYQCLNQLLANANVLPSEKPNLTKPNKKCGAVNDETMPSKKTSNINVSTNGSISNINSTNNLWDGTINDDNMDASTSWAELVGENVNGLPNTKPTPIQLSTPIPFINGWLRPSQVYLHGNS